MTLNGKWEHSIIPIDMVSTESVSWFIPEEEIPNQVAIILDNSQEAKFTSQDKPHYLKVCLKINELINKLTMMVKDSIISCKFK